MRDRRTSSAWLFAAFPLLIIAVFTVLPTLAGIGLSLFEWSGGGRPVFVGLENYRAAVADDRQLGYALRNTILFAIVTVPVTTLLGFALAVPLHASWFVGRTALRTVFFLPSVVSIVAIGFVWRWVLDPQAGLARLAVDATGWSGELPAWLGDTPWALAALAGIHVWRQLGFAIVLYLAALSAVPRSLHEAAGLDGAGSWRSVWHVSWPAVRPMTAFLVITGAIWSLQIFDLVWVMTGGAQQRWTDVVNVHLYREFASNRLGYAATIGVVVLAISAAATALQWRWVRSGEEGAT